MTFPTCSITRNPRLFLVDEAQCGEEGSEIDPSAVCGDMPRNSKVGFLFAKNAADQASFNRTVAHELGHGAFAYEHPFDNAAYTVDQGTTHNLMDYVKDDELAYFQWQSTLGLNLTWGFLEGDEEGMGLFDWYHWIPNDKWFDDKSIDQIKEHEGVMEYVCENRSAWIYLKQSQTWDKYTKWTVGKNNNLPSIWLSVKNNKSTTLKDLKAYHIYAYANTIVSETKEVYDYREVL